MKGLIKLPDYKIKTKMKIGKLQSGMNLIKHVMTPINENETYIDKSRIGKILNKLKFSLKLK